MILTARPTRTLLEDVAGTAFRYEGAPGTTVAGFWDEVCWAAGVVAAYEARLNRDYNEARTLLTGEFAFLDIARSGVEREWWWQQLKKRFGEQVAEELASLVVDQDLMGIKKFTTREPDLAERIVLELNGTFLLLNEEPEPLGEALSFAYQTVEEKVKALCYPRLVYGDDACSYSSASPQAGWGARNLLGVMYLQMYWLMTSGGNLARCEYCGRLITLSRPNPDGRKRRSDKRFCDDACRQAHHRAKKRS